MLLLQPVTWVVGSLGRRGCVAVVVEREKSKMPWRLVRGVDEVRQSG